MGVGTLLKWLFTPRSPEEKAKAAEEKATAAWLAVSTRSAAKEATGDCAGSIAELTAGIESQVFTGNNLGILLIHRGGLKERLGDTTGALADLSAAAGMSNISSLWRSKALLNLGLFKGGILDLPGAVADLTTALEAGGLRVDDEARAWLQRGRARARLQDFGDAKADFEKVLAQEYGNSDTKRLASADLEAVEKMMRGSVTLPSRVENETPMTEVSASEISRLESLIRASLTGQEPPRQDNDVVMRQLDRIFDQDTDLLETFLSDGALSQIQIERAVLIYRTMRNQS